MDYPTALLRLDELAEQFEITDSLSLRAELDREMEALEAYLLDLDEATD